MANSSRNLACSWITTHYLLVSRGALPIIYLFRLHLPVVPLTGKSDLPKFLLTLSPYGGAVAMLLCSFQISPATHLWAAVQRCWKTRDTPVLFSTAFWMLALLPSTRRVANPSHTRSRLLQKRITVLAALLPWGSTCRLYVN